MGAVFRKSYTVELPASSERFTRQGEQFARWKDAKGKTRTAKVTTGRDGSQRIVQVSTTFTAKFRDGSGIVREVATGSRTKDGALSVLKSLTDRAAKVQSRILTAAEDETIDHQQTPLAEHFAEYVASLNAADNSRRYIDETVRLFNRVAFECRFVRLGDIQWNAVVAWLNERKTEGMAARTRNSYVQAVAGFSKWCVSHSRLLVDPMTNASRADEKSDRRRQRRAMTEGELNRLLHVARWRPLAEQGRLAVAKPSDSANESRKRSNWTYAPLTYDDLDDAVKRARERLADNPAFVAELEQSGRERALIYKTLTLTGLRKGELASITVGQLDLERSPAFLTLNAADEKNREGSTLPLRDDLADDLRQWLASKATARQDAARNALTVRFDSADTQSSKRARNATAKREGASCGDWASLPAAELLFVVPDKLVKIFDRDLQAAGIAKRDERGRTLDVHALRHSFGTLLSKGGVSPRTAQAAMRHSRIDLTMNVYTDPKLLDLHAAVESLPELRLDAGRQEQRATGTDARTPSVLAPNLAPDCRKLVQERANKGMNDAVALALSKSSENEKTPEKQASACDSGVFRKGWLRGVEPPTLRATICGNKDLSEGGLRLTSLQDSSCTDSCTSSAEDADASPPDADLQALLALWPQLAPAARSALLAMARATVK